MTDNVVKFEPRRREAPALFIEFRLLEDFRIEISLHDSGGRIGAVEYAVKSPPDFDLNLLRAQWDRLREAPEDVA